MVRGTWLTWFIANVPPRLASIIFDLKYLKATVSDADMVKLIRFHDANRKYPATALVDDVRAIIKNELKHIPRYLTLDEARHLMRQACGGGRLNTLRRRSEKYCKLHLPRWVWEREDLSPQTIRIVGVLAKLSSRGGIPQKYESRFKDISSLRLGFIWNPKIGLAYCSYDQTGGNVYIFRDSRWGVFVVEPRYFKSIEPYDMKVVRELEDLAFPADASDLFNSFKSGLNS
jgi:hypothetical protein